MVKNIALFLALLMMISSMGRSLTVPAEYDEYYKELNRKYHYDEYYDLYDAVVFNTAEPGMPDFMSHTEAQRALLVVLIFDMEIQNGGIAQYFWNTGPDYALLTSESLRIVGFNDVADLYERFVSENGITLAEISSYRERFPADEDWAEFTNLHPFDDFDDAYMEIWHETDFNQRLINYAAQHPEVYYRQ